MGIEKTRMRAPQLFYWPKMSMDIEKMVSSCLICEKYRHNNQKDPLQQYDSPKYPFHKVAMDIFEYAGKSFLALIDAYSGWICAEKLNDKSINE